MRERVFYFGAEVRVVLCCSFFLSSSFPCFLLPFLLLGKVLSSRTLSKAGTTYIEHYSLWVLSMPYNYRNMAEVEERERAAKARRLSVALDRISFGCASLDLASRNREHALDDAHIVTLAAALASNTTVTECNLEHNCITDDGAAVLATTVLECNVTLRTLNLSKNLIGRNGLASLERVLRGANTTLTSLDVSSMWETATWDRTPYVDTRIEQHLRRNRKIREALRSRFPCSVHTFQSTILLGALQPPPAEAAAWRVDDELFDELLGESLGDVGVPSGGDGASGGCVLQRLNDNGTHFATRFKQRIADFAGCRYRSAVKEWSEAKCREHDEGSVLSDDRSEGERGGDKGGRRGDEGGRGGDKGGWGL